MWNRLALVATALTIAVAPVVIQSSMYSQGQQIQESLFGYCLDAASNKLTRDVRNGTAQTYQADVDACRASWEKHDRDSTITTWRNWRELVVGTAAACAVLYVLLWLVGYVGRWIWAGRKVPIVK